MDSFLAILESPAAVRLGYALLHFVWQGALIGLAASALLVCLKRSAAVVRYNVLLALLMTAAAAPLANFYWLVPAPALAAEPGGSHHGLVESASGPRGSEPGGQSQHRWLFDRGRQGAGDRMDIGSSHVPDVRQSTSPRSGRRLHARMVDDWLATHVAWIVGGWFTGAALFGLRLLSGWVGIRRIRGRGTQPVDGRFTAIAARLAARLGIERPLELRQSDRVEVPAVVGWLKPVVLLPAAALCGLSPAQFEAVLAHELAHVRRHDYLVNVLQVTVEALLFYHPVIWWISRRLRIEREYCCDDLAVAACCNRLEYASALAMLEGLRPRMVNPALAASGGLLKRRIVRLLAGPPEQARHGWLPMAAVLSMAAAGFAIKPWYMAAAVTEERRAVAIAPASEGLLPDTTIAFVSVPDLPGLAASWATTGLSRLTAEPAMQPFMADLERTVERRFAGLAGILGFSIGDLLELTKGEACLALIPRAEEESLATALLLDVAQREGDARRALKEAADKVHAAGGERSISKVAGIEITSVAPAARDGLAARPVVFMLHEGLLVLTDETQLAARIARLKNAQADGSLLQSAAWRGVMQPCRNASQGREPHLRWFVRPFALAGAGRAQSARRKSGVEWRRVLEHTGFNGLQAVGGHVNVGAGRYEILHRTAVFAPRPYRGSMRMLVFPDTLPEAPQPWAPARGVAGYASFHCNLQNAFEYFGNLFDAAYGEPGIWLDTIGSIRDDPNGPQLDLDRDLVAHLGQRVTLLSRDRHFLLAVELTDPAAMHVSITRSMEGDPTAAAWNIGGQQYWEIKSGDAAAPTSSGLAVAKGHLFIASDVGLLRTILAETNERDSLGNDPEYWFARAELARLDPHRHSALSFVRLAEYLEPAYELFRQGKPFEAQPIPIRVAGGLLPIADEQGRLVGGTRLPPYEVVRSYLGPSGAVVRSTDDGWLVTGFMAAPAR